MQEDAKPTRQYSSETSKHREDILPFCQGYGLDVGFGGDPINPAVIRMDMPSPYANTGEYPVQLGGDCRNLRWIASDSLDYVYSSHVLEDFDRNETEPVLREWIRIIKPGGLIVLLLPDQPRYVESCLRRGEVWANGVIGNPHHSIADFSMQYVMEVAAKIGYTEKHHSVDTLGEYSFLLVLKKIKPTGETADKVAELEAALSKAWKERDELKLAVREKDRELNQLRKTSVIRRAGRKVKRALGL
jgi:predicted SAM-dependent methyltransferase